MEGQQQESLEAMQARHRKEQRDLQSRVTSKKKNTTKKTRKGVNDECAELERQLKARQEQELVAAQGGGAEADDKKGEELQGEDDAADQAAGQLKNTSLSKDERPPSPLPPASEDAAGPQQPAAKKRNRQKERMARRAAEQEAAAEAAEAEAATMTDHRTIEKTYLLREFKAHNLVEQEIRPDGHCLFAAVADQLQQQAVPLGGDDAAGVPPYRTTRSRAADYMRAHADDFAPFLADEGDFDAYLARMRDTAEWGGQLELTALARAYGVEIRVLQDGRTDTIEPGEDTTAAAATGGDETPKRIWLAYYRHGYGLGEHYNSLRKAT